LTPSQASPASPRTLDLKPGEYVRVRPSAEIFATLDERGTLEGLPYMPEMIKFSGRILQVAQRADKTCAGDGVTRRMRNAVHLDSVRCDGSAHGGCQAACLMFWKEAWLERVEGPRAKNGRALGPNQSLEEARAFVENVLRPPIKRETAEGPRYTCQATDIKKASEPLRFRQVDQYVRDVRNWNLKKIVRGLIIEVFNLYQGFSTRHVPKALWIGNGRQYPFVDGKLEKGTTPRASLGLQPGDLVRIKSKAEIEATLDKTNHNRGLSFDNEMSNYCGRVARVQARVNRLIEESTGEMLEIKSDCIILEGVVCTSDYHRFCTRAIYAYWREVWLEKLESAPTDDELSASCSGTC
jgi:hypothetical protein